MDRDELVGYTIENLQTFVRLARITDGGSRTMDHHDLRTVRAMALTVYMSAMPGHTTLSGPEELMPLMRSDWELLMAAWDEAGGAVRG